MNWATATLVSGCANSPSINHCNDLLKPWRALYRPSRVARWYFSLYLLFQVPMKKKEEGRRRVNNAKIPIHWAQLSSESSRSSALRPMSRWPLSLIESRALPQPKAGVHKLKCCCVNQRSLRPKVTNDKRPFGMENQWPVGCQRPTTDDQQHLRRQNLAGQNPTVITPDAADFY